MMFPAIDGSWSKDNVVHYVKYGEDYYMYVIIKKTLRLLLKIIMIYRSTVIIELILLLYVALFYSNMTVMNVSSEG